MNLPYPAALALLIVISLHFSCALGTDAIGGRVMGVKGVLKTRGLYW